MAHHINFQALGGRLTQAGLTGKPVNAYSQEEVETLVQACIDCLSPDPVNFANPYIDKDGVLRIPAGSDPKYWWWSKGQSIWATLKELGASEEILSRYCDAAKAPF